MERKHTPGPWITRWDGLVGIKVPSSRGRMMFHDIAWTVLPKRDSEGHIIGYEEQKEIREANARLIAASPELLAALESLMDDAEDTGEFSYPAMSQARAAIAKAKGEQS
jgi:hypothetical protein